MGRGVSITNQDERAIMPDPDYLIAEALRILNAQASKSIAG
jgi:hypothetical protein